MVVLWWCCAMHASFNERSMLTVILDDPLRVVLIPSLFGYNKSGKSSLCAIIILAKMSTVNSCYGQALKLTFFFCENQAIKPKFL